MDTMRYTVEWVEYNETKALKGEKPHEMYSKEFGSLWGAKHFKLSLYESSKMINSAKIWDDVEAMYI